MKNKKYKFEAVEWKGETLTKPIGDELNDEEDYIYFNIEDINADLDEDTKIIKKGELKWKVKYYL